MAKLKMLKYPKKPKTTASNTTKENFLKKVADIDKENRRREAENKKGDVLTKRVQAVRKK